LNEKLLQAPASFLPLRMSGDWISEDGAGVLILVDLKPAAQRSGIVGTEPWRGRLRIRVKAPPVDGSANSELLKLLSEVLGVERSRLSLLRGAGSRRKTVRVESISIAEAKSSLGY
jgi:hypothetical protein